MRAMKKTVSVLLALMLVLGMATMGMSVASAAANTVSVTSNIAPTQTIEFNEQSEQVVATYCLQSDKNIINVEGVITYDPTVLKIADTNTASTCFPSITSNLIANLTKTDGRIPFNASDFQNGYDFSSEAVLATVTFDIIGTGDTTVNLEVKSLTATETLGTAEDEILIEDDVDNGGYTGAGAVKVLPEEPTVDPSVFIGDVRLNLQGKIGFNFYFVQNPENYNNVTFEFVGPADNAAQNVTVSLASLPKAQRKGTVYKFYTYYLYAHMMTQELKVNVYADGEFVTSDTYTVEDWALDHMAEFQAADPNQAVLLKATLNYGAAVQTQFNKYTDALANREITDYPVQRITADTIQIPSGMNINPDLSSIGATFSKMTAELKDGTAIRLTILANDISKFNSKKDVTCKGTVLPYIDEVLTNRTRVAMLDNVTSKDLDTAYTFTFANGATYTTSVMSYLKGLLSNENVTDNVANLCSAMYWYNQAANTVFEA